MSAHPLDDPALHERIRRVAASMRGRLPLPDSDEDEVTQRLTEVVLRRLPGFNPARGTIESFVTMAADCAASSVLRHAYQAKRDPNRVRCLDDVASPTIEGVQTARLEHGEHQHRLTRALSQMDEPDRQLAHDIMRFGVAHACNRLGLTRSQRVQAIARIRLTLEAENILDSSEIRRRRARRGVSN